MNKYKVVYQPETSMSEEWNEFVEAESFSQNHDKLFFWHGERLVAAFSTWAYVVPATEADEEDDDA